MLKQVQAVAVVVKIRQPPSGGCVLKPSHRLQHCNLYRPAAFGRLCVETSLCTMRPCRPMPAAFGRLCVETSNSGQGKGSDDPAAFGRLCVETGNGGGIKGADGTSRLRAAVC